ncbi:MAG: GAF domain-containing protein, partial [Candidatus Omnitrophota bacterium]
MQTQSVEDTAVRTGLRIIHLEDDQNDAELIARQLAKDGVAAAVKRVRTKEEFIRALNERAPELILADYRIPGFDGLDALKVAREKYPETPFIFVSGAIGEEFAIETLTHGATDYVLKDRLVRLVPALRRSLHDARLRVERAHARERLKTMNRELEMVNECHRLAIRSKNEKTLLDQICRKLVELGGYRMSWAGLLVANAQGALAPAAKAGYEMGYVKSIQKNAAPASSAIEPAFVAVRTGEIVVNRNTRSNPTPFPWKEEALERGYASSIALPLTIDNRIIGALSIYAERPDSFHPEEARLLGALAEDLAFGIGALRARSGRTRAVREMRLSHRQLLQSNKRLEKIAIKDPLTGLYNNRYLSDALGAELTRAGRFAQHLSLIILDIDYFKSINSVYGRAFGNSCNRISASRRSRSRIH